MTQKRARGDLLKDEVRALRVLGRRGACWEAGQTRKGQRSPGTGAATEAKKG